MKSKLFRVMVVLMILATLTLTNFIYVGVGAISYAASANDTNHKNVEFTANLKDEKTLTLGVNVKNEGYFNGEVSLENNNFKMKSSSSEYVNKVEENKITLNQINAGTNVQIDVEIEPMKDDSFIIGLLTAQTKVKLSGIYKDRTEKDINIKASRDVKLDYTYQKEDNVESSIDVITNKVLKVNGEEKRVVQLSLNMGLKSNEYPTQEISAELTVPELNGEKPTVVAKANLNTMTTFEYNYDGKSKISLNLKNEPNSENKVKWKKQGTENVVLTFVYNKDADVKNSKITLKENVKLYDNNILQTENAVVIAGEEKEAIMKLSNTNIENVIYKGKLNANINRNFATSTTIAVNLANVGTGIDIKENAVEQAKVIYNKTYVSKEAFDKVLGQNGTMTLSNQNGEVITTLTNASQVDENGNIVVDYGDKEVTALEVKTSIPVSEGDLTVKHIKTILPEANIKDVDKISTSIETTYGTEATLKTDNEIALENATTEATMQVNKNTLSTVVANNVEIRATLKSNNEKNNLYTNPSLQFELPEAVESADIISAELIYESELKIKNYSFSGKTITVNLEGTQTGYKEDGIEGAILILNVDLKLNRKAPTQESKITMTVNNKGETIKQETEMKVVAPTDMTVINNISNLGVETIGQEESTTATLQRGKNSQDLDTNIEVINNNESKMQNVKIVGTFPTKTKNNNIDISISNGINVSGVEGLKTYYTDNENATDDLQNPENGWQESIDNNANVKKYLIEVPEMETGASVEGTYNTTVPASLEYNQQASQGYTVKYENATTGASNEIKATTINMETGIGPKVETKITASSLGKDLADASTVKNGEVIKYKVEISNVGSEDVKDVLVQGTVPEGTVLVEPEANYEYTGSSYYKELDNKTYETKIDTLKTGESLSKEYEVRVKADTAVGTKLQATSSVKYGDVTKQATSPVIATETGKLRVTVKRVTDRKTDLYESGMVQYYAIIENISDKPQNDVKVKTNLPDSVSVSRLTLIDNLPSEEVSDNDINGTTEDIATEQVEGDLQEATGELAKTEQVEYKDELNLGTIEPGKNKVLSYDLNINKLNNANTVDFSVQVTSDKITYNSNTVSDNVVKTDISMAMTANPTTKYLKAGDSIEYTITVKNNSSQRVDGIELKDEIPPSLTVNKVTIDGKEEPELKEINKLDITLNIAAGSEMTVKVEAIVNYSESRTQAESITNVAYAELLANKVATTQEITHIIEATENGGNGSNNGDNKVDDNDVAKGTAVISGMAWVDENGNGQKDDNEKTLSGIKVRLYNTETGNLVKDSNGNTLEATTNDNGIYTLSNLGNGKYIAIFDYNNSEYGLSKYKVSGVASDKSSSALVKKLTIDGNEQEVASTDILEINNQNISDINIGLIQLKDFSFKLDKFVNKVVIQDSKGSTLKEYGDETLARAEIDGKKVNGTTVLIEYKIRVTNIGEVDGYVRKIADYAPTDLKFNSELNKDWYQASDGIYSTSLSNTKLAAGQSAELTLTLTKAMTENNLGLINNSAEISEEYNELGMADKDSTPGNKVKGEKDYGSADLILGVKTGGEVYVGITIAIIAILGVAVFVIYRIKKDKKEIGHIKDDIEI